ncbi:hypothetical protein AN396_00380 [Candidatus Epulonipiscium fishelsonii]|uniref:Uncharacterized protein n=1 Tax=Candidatus Epulonipiscium fishelsonii TaxID=77094 RepID=A0ACC8XFU1_9FIRM|nr:hypothetical protein AN396_00380 [Epulopiscium sp. SCG-B11WGA-EpuloA1]
MRTNNSLKNMATGLISQGIGLVISFIVRMVFIQTLGTDYLGVNGLFSNILTMLSLAEMGIGSAIIFALYAPLANRDIPKINQLMNFYKKIYMVIGVFVLLAGLCLVPFLEELIKDTPNIPHLKIIYLLFLLQTVSSYFFAYRKSLISADQKTYIMTIYYRIMDIFLRIAQVIMLILTRNYIVYLSLWVGMTILENIVIAYKAHKMYPFLKEAKGHTLDKNTKQEIAQKARALIYYRIGGVLVGGTDNLIISRFVGIAYVGLFSNYVLITQAISGFIGQIFGATTASIGNLNAVEGKDKAFKIYTQMLFFNFWIVTFCSISIWILANPFITLWLGPEFLFNPAIVLVIVLNFYLSLSLQTTSIYRSVFGLFIYGKFVPLCQAFVNIVVSIGLAVKFGVIGVFLGTTISTLTTVFFAIPYYLYKYGFDMSIKDYFTRYFKYTAVALTSGVLTTLLCNQIVEVSLYTLIIRGVICLIIPNFMFIACFNRTEEFNQLYVLFKTIIKNRKV